MMDSWSAAPYRVGHLWKPAQVYPSAAESIGVGDLQHWGYYAVWERIVVLARRDQEVDGHQDDELYRW